MSRKESFDVWLDRGLSSLFEEIGKEPIPASIIRIIEDDRMRKHDEVGGQDSEGQGAPEALGPVFRMGT